jgi:hypothetical protein
LTSCEKEETTPFWYISAIASTTRTDGFALEEEEEKKKTRRCFQQD